MLEARPGNMIFIGNGDTAACNHPAFDFNECGDPAWRVVLGAPRRDRDAGMMDRRAGDRLPERSIFSATISIVACATERASPRTLVSRTFAPKATSSSHTPRWSPSL